MAFAPVKYYLTIVKVVSQYLWSDKAVSSRSAFLRYSFTILLISITTLIKIHFFKYIGINTPFLLYFAIVIIATGFGGIGPGIFATIYSSLLSSYFFLSPFHVFTFGKFASIPLLVFMLECLLLISLSGAVTRAGKRLRRSADRFRAMLENSADAIAVLNTDGKPLYASPTTLRVIGYTAKEFKRFDFFTKVHPEESKFLREQFYEVLQKEGDVKTLLHRYLHKNGQWVWIENTITNLLKDPVVNGIVSNFRNVSERLMLEKQKDDFIGIATHELKTPVTSIKAYAQILDNRFRKEGNMAAAEMVQKMDGQLNKLIGLIGDLLDVTKIEGGRLELHEEWYDFNHIIVEVVEELQRTTERHKIEMKLVPVAKIFGDKERIGQVVTNLVANAIKYSPKSDVILLQSSASSSEVTLSVKDFGVGISRDQQSRVFERFFRVNDHLSHTYPGLGLGLFISAEIIKRQGGRIWVESEPGEGSIFSFSVPFEYRVAININ